MFNYFPLNPVQSSGSRLYCIEGIIFDSSLGTLPHSCDLCGSGCSDVQNAMCITWILAIGKGGWMRFAWKSALKWDLVLCPTRNSAAKACRRLPHPNESMTKALGNWGQIFVSERVEKMHTAESLTGPPPLSSTEELRIPPSHYSRPNSKNTKALDLGQDAWLH